MWHSVLCFWKCPKTFFNVLFTAIRCVSVFFPRCWFCSHLSSLIIVIYQAFSSISCWCGAVAVTAAAQTDECRTVGSTALCDMEIRLQQSALCVCSYKSSLLSRFLQHEFFLHDSSRTAECIIRKHVFLLFCETSVQFSGSLHSLHSQSNRN